MSECAKCGHDDWTYFSLEYKGEPYLMEACRNCTAVKPEGLVEPLTAAIKADLEVSVELETDSEKIARMDAMLCEIYDMLTNNEEAE